MSANDTKGKNEKKGFTGFSCCSGNLEGMREMMNNFCGGANGVPDCSTLMKGMMENCCGSKEENAQSDSETQNKPGPD
jgi:hypothetical protein